MILKPFRIYIAKWVFLSISKLPDVQEGLEGQRLGESAMTAVLGPVAAIGVNALKGLQEMSEGRYARGASKQWRRPCCAARSRRSATAPKV